MSETMCPDCGVISQSVCEWQPDKYPIKIDGREYELTIVVPVERCQHCNLQWTDHRAGEIRDNILFAYYPDHPDRT